MSCDPENAVDQIKDGLWIGGVRALVDTTVMQHIDVVISIIERDRIPEPIYPLSIGGRPHLRIYIADGDITLIDHLSRISRFISEHREHNNILIHCMAGRSRSVIVLAYYMVTRMGYTNLEIALDKIATRRPSVRPKDELMQATQDYLNKTWYAVKPSQIVYVPDPRRLTTLIPSFYKNHL
jgi:predicted protein tyrosine phosphatase